MNRRTFLRIGVFAALGFAGMDAISPRTWAARARSVLGEAAGSSIRFNFRSASDRALWGPRWLPHLYARQLDVRDGAARFVLPDGLDTTAPAQPMPVFLLDCDSRQGTQVLSFSSSNASLRVGVLFGGRPPFAYFAVTVEKEYLVLARYFRSDRAVVRRIRTGRLKRGTLYTLKVARSRSGVRAKLWAGPHEPREWKLDLPLQAARLGCFGVLVVHPVDRRAAALGVRGYRLWVPGRFAATKPQVPFAISGIPEDGAVASRRVRVRAAGAIPASIQFEWFYDDPSALERSADQPALEPPYTAASVIDIPAGSPLHWRARVRSASSGARSQSRWHTLPSTGSGSPIVIAAASCAHVWGKPVLSGFEQARIAAPAPIRALVYQGDLGYANNSYHSSYLSAEDFFADRFGRFLADPKFAALRRGSSVAFTLDDHDYGPRNNAWSETVEPWAIDLWNRMHADGSDLGYTDFRFADVHCLTLDNRRYADKADSSPEAQISRLGPDQFDWMERILTGSDAEIFLVFSAGIFASRRRTNDCFLFGWRMEYDRALSLFHDVQLSGKRVVVVSGDAHGCRIHHHPDPAERKETAGLSVVEFVCSGLEARTWTAAVATDQTLDPARSVMGTSGLGLVVVDAPGVSGRTVTLRAIAARRPQRPDLFRPLVLPFRPKPTADVPLRAPAPRRWLETVPQE
jgi:hypothetical protein